MTPEEQARLVELAGMKKECIYCHGTGYTHEPFAGRGQGGQNDTNAKYMCEGCHGTGEVYILDAGVRVPCKKRHIYGRPEGVNWCTAPETYPARLITCAEAGCRGWTPTGDFVKWCWALQPYVLNVCINPRDRTVDCGWRNTPPAWANDAERILTALARR